MVKPALAVTGLLIAFSTAVAQELPPPPEPAENPVTEAKRVLGKVLFWDEQLSSDTTVACGTCHRGAAGGSDARLGIHPGPDGIAPSPDDVAGSPGVRRRAPSGAPILDPVFGFNVQVTGRSANSVIGAAYAPDLFWDGRATSEFRDPETGQVSIPFDGALESQAVQPVLSHVEMARDGRTWTDVKAKLAVSHPLSDATNLPPDLQAALAGGVGYGDLFTAAFGDPAITAERIAFAIATYERTLVPDGTPWDKYMAGEASAMTPGQVAGWEFFVSSSCGFCHVAPTFTNSAYHNLGLRPSSDDPGRQNVTGSEFDRGAFKTPGLRNGGLKPTFMHNGRLSSMTEAVLWYRSDNPARFTDNLDPILPVNVPPEVLPGLVDFLSNALTDPRVAAESFPFDKPGLHGGALPRLLFPDHGTLQWPPLQGVLYFGVYRGDLASLRQGGGYGTCEASTAGTTLLDGEDPSPGEGFFYLKSVVDGTGAERGLGVNSEGVPRSVLVSCPPP